MWWIRRTVIYFWDKQQINEQIEQIEQWRDNIEQIEQIEQKQTKNNPKCIY